MPEITNITLPVFFHHECTGNASSQVGLREVIVFDSDDFICIAPVVDQDCSIVPEEKLSQRDISSKSVAPTTGMIESEGAHIEKYTIGRLREDGVNLPNQNMNKIKEYSVKDDGACLFRAIATLLTRQKEWLRKATKEVLLEFLNESNISKQIFNAIKNSINSMKENNIPGSELADCFSKNYSTSLEELIFQETIANSDFTLWSPVGVAKALGLKLNERVREDLEVFCDLVYQNIIEEMKLKITHDKNSVGIFREGNHYSLCLEADYNWAG